MKPRAKWARSVKPCVLCPAPSKEKHNAPDSLKERPGDVDGGSQRVVHRVPEPAVHALYDVGVGVQRDAYAGVA